jgi:glycolate oxidase
VTAAVDGVSAVIRAGVVPAALELVDEPSLRAVEAYVGESLVPPGAGALVVIECDGMPAGVEEEVGPRAGPPLARRVPWRWCVRAPRPNGNACGSSAGSSRFRCARRAPTRSTTTWWCRAAACRRSSMKVERLRGAYGLTFACFGHAGDGNIHVNILIDRTDPDQRARAASAERELFARVVALEGSISGEHGIGFTKAQHLDLELSPEVIALMRRVKAAFDPAGILNPGKIFPPAAS